MTIFQLAEMWEETRRKSIKSPEGKHFLAHQPLEDGEDQQYPVRSYRKRFGERIDLVRLFCNALFPRSYFMLKSIPGTLTSIQRS